MGEADPAAIATTQGTAEASASGPRGVHGNEALDLQSVVSDALRRLAETTGSSRACAWAERPDGEPYLVAAQLRDDSAPRVPDRATMTVLGCIFEANEAIDLGAQGDEVARIALEHGVTSAAPLVSSHGERIAVLLLGGTEDPLGRVRPRTLATLASTTERLRLPATAAHAIARLANLDAEVDHLDRLSVLGDLLTEVAHEIRNPLVSMKTFLHLLPSRRDDEEFTGEFREVVLSELGRMERLLDTLLAHARPTVKQALDPSQDTTSDLQHVFDSLMRLLEQRANEREVKLVARIEGQTSGIALAEDRLRQIVLNLVLNALEASPPSSAVELQATSTPDRMYFSVEDRGPGIAEDAREKIFEPFFSTHRNGAGGLGLAITRKLG